MIELHITKTSKGYAPSEKFSIYDTERKQFATIEEAKEWLKETYGTSKRVPMYNENLDDKQTGYIIGFRNSSWDNGTKYNFIEQHWIEFRSIETLVIGDAL